MRALTDTHARRHIDTRTHTHAGRERERERERRMTASLTVCLAAVCGGGRTLLVPRLGARPLQAQYSPPRSLILPLLPSVVNCLNVSRSFFCVFFFFFFALAKPCLLLSLSLSLSLRSSIPLSPRPPSRPVPSHLPLSSSAPLISGLGLQIMLQCVARRQAHASAILKSFGTSASLSVVSLVLCRACSLSLSLSVSPSPFFSLNLALSVSCVPFLWSLLVITPHSVLSLSACVRVCACVYVSACVRVC